MNKAEIRILERAFVAEINSAFDCGPGLLQTKSKLAETLADNKLLRKVTVSFGNRFPVDVTGYRLTHAGRMAYCMTCRDVDEDL